MLRCIALTLLVFLYVSSLAQTEEASFRRVKVPDVSGHQAPAVLTFSDSDKAVEVAPSKGDRVTIPYAQIDKCSYEFTKKHRLAPGIIVGSVSPAAGLVVFLTHSKSHWLEVDYHDQDARKLFVLRMDKKNYVRILEALKAHTGIDADVLGNADKRHK